MSDNIKGFIIPYWLGKQIVIDILKVQGYRYISISNYENEYGGNPIWFVYKKLWKCRRK